MKNTTIRVLALCLFISLFCIGAVSAASPVCGNGFKEGGEKCDDGNIIPGDGCSATCKIESGYTCLGEPSICIPICGDGLIIKDEQCELPFDTCCDSSTCKFKSSSTLCRFSFGVCDIAETCTGNSATCPSDVKSTAECRAAVGVCDVAETCDGVGNDCPVDAFKPLGTLCPDGAYCNGDETCDSSGNCQVGTQISCFGNDLSGIATCGNTPDSNPFTWDFRSAFTSICDEGTDSCTTGDETITHTGNDNDGDGYASTCGDCDDASAAIHPGVTEACNGLDDDCDGQSDEGFNVGIACQSDPNICNFFNTGVYVCTANGQATECNAIIPDLPALYGQTCSSDANVCGVKGEGTYQCDGLCNAVIPTISDVDSDGTADCLEECDNDPNKLDPGVCGCGVADTDSDGDGTPDCNDVDGEGDEGDEGVVCGDGTCDSEESCSSCEADCGVCPITQNPPSGDSGSSGGGGGGGGGTKIRIETEIICEEISRTCTDWSKCTSTGIQSRSCQILKSCGNQIQTKTEWEEQKCVYEGLEEKTLTKETQVQEGYPQESENTKSSPTGAAITEMAFNITEKKLFLFPAVIVLTSLFIFGIKSNVHIKTYRKLKLKLRKMMPCMF